MVKRILNLTQHPATPSQRKAGVVEPDEELKKEIKRLLTFEELPDKVDISTRAYYLAQIAYEAGYKFALIGGAPYLMSALERHLKASGVTPVYAFSKRETIEKTMPDGSVVKTQVFKHLGFIEVK